VYVPVPHGLALLDDFDTICNDKKKKKKKQATFAAITSKELVNL